MAGDDFHLTPAQEADALRILQETCTHHQSLIEIFHSRIFPLLQKQPHPTRFLEIGPGTGAITRKLHAYFDSTVVVEPNLEVFKFRSPNLQVIHSDFLAACASQAPSLAPGSFDLIICSHVMYHLTAAQCREWIQHMVQLLKPRGAKALIMIAAPSGVGHELHCQITDEPYTHSRSLVAAVHALAASVAVAVAPKHSTELAAPEQQQHLTPEELTQVVDTLEVLPSVNTMSSTDKEAMVNLVLYFLKYDCGTEALERWSMEALRQMAVDALQQQQQAGEATAAAGGPLSSSSRSLSRDEAAEQRCLVAGEDASRIHMSLGEVADDRGQGAKAASKWVFMEDQECLILTRP